MTGLSSCDFITRWSGRTGWMGAERMHWGVARLCFTEWGGCSGQALYQQWRGRSCSEDEQRDDILRTEGWILRRKEGWRGEKNLWLGGGKTQQWRSITSAGNKHQAHTGGTEGTSQIRASENHNKNRTNRFQAHGPAVPILILSPSSSLTLPVEVPLPSYQPLILWSCCRFFRPCSQSLFFSSIMDDLEISTSCFLSLRGCIDSYARGVIKATIMRFPVCAGSSDPTSPVVCPAH